MSPEKILQLKTEFPLLYRRLAYFECDDGWFNLIFDMSSKLEKLIKNQPNQILDVNKIDTDTYDQQMYIVQLKEKFALLRIYDQGFTKKMRQIIHQAEASSAYICEVCGKEGKLGRIGNWMKTLCEEHK